MLQLSDFKCKFDENLLGIVRKGVLRAFANSFESEDFADDVEMEGELSFRFSFKPVDLPRGAGCKRDTRAGFLGVPQGAELLVNLLCDCE